MANPSNAYLTFLLCWIRATVSVNMLSHSTVRGLPSGHWHRHITKRAYRYLDILQLRSRAQSVTYSRSTKSLVLREPGYALHKRTMFPARRLKKNIGLEMEGQRDSGDSACILHSPAITFKPPPHLLVSRSTVMLSVGHMVCAEDARAGVALERQKICREWVRLQV